VKIGFPFGDQQLRNFVTDQAQTSGMGRGRVKTLFDTEFGCSLTIAEVPIVDPGAFYEVKIFLH